MQVQKYWKTRSFYKNLHSMYRKGQKRTLTNFIQTTQNEHRHTKHNRKSVPSQPKAEISNITTSLITIHTMYRKGQKRRLWSIVKRSRFTRICTLCIERVKIKGSQTSSKQHKRNIDTQNTIENLHHHRQKLKCQTSQVQLSHCTLCIERVKNAGSEVL